VSGVNTGWERRQAPKRRPERLDRGELLSQSMRQCVVLRRHLKGELS